MQLTEIIFITLLSFFGLALLFIFVYSIAQIQLVGRYLNKTIPEKPILNPENFPKVCIQLPIFNEMYVATRLLDSVVKVDYPNHLLEIQVLDDSIDETQEILKSKVNELATNGININYIHRKDRTGYKAGALKNAIPLTNAELIAIFDADFIPSTDFLLATVPYFKNEKVGLVQTCWEHLNKNYSLLTKLQAFALDAHFSVEQVGRNAKNNFINFNGTAGIWRKKCIINAGNWSADTLTEDLDLSYRAQLKNWKFIYLEDLKSPAELPPVMSALRSQQYRWTKGGAETAKKHLWRVLNSHKSFADKWHAFFHLLNSSIFVSILLTGIISLPILLLKQDYPQYNRLFIYSSIFLLSFLSISVLYAVSSVQKFESKNEGWKHFFKHYFLFLSFSMGLSFHNAVAVIEGYAGRKTPFVRTPKFNIDSENSTWTSGDYLKGKISFYLFFEVLLFFYFVYALAIGIINLDFSLFFFHLLLALGFGMVCFYSLFDKNSKSKKQRN